MTYKELAYLWKIKNSATISPGLVFPLSKSHVQRKTPCITLRSAVLEMKWKKEETCQLTISYTFTHNNRVRSLARLDKNTIHTETIHDTHATTTATSRKTSPHIRSWSHFSSPFRSSKFKRSGILRKENKRRAKIRKWKTKIIEERERDRQTER